MDYSITIAGTTDDAEETEDELLEEVQEFVGGLDGVTAATFSSPNFANVDLTEEEDVVSETPAEPGDGNGTDEDTTPEPEPKPDEGDGEE